MAQKKFRGGNFGTKLKNEIVPLRKPPPLCMWPFGLASGALRTSPTAVGRRPERQRPMEGGPTLVRGHLMTVAATPPLQPLALLSDMCFSLPRVHIAPTIVQREYVIPRKHNPDGHLPKGSRGPAVGGADVSNSIS